MLMAADQLVEPGRKAGRELTFALLMIVGPCDRDLAAGGSGVVFANIRIDRARERLAVCIVNLDDFQACRALTAGSAIDDCAAAIGCDDQGSVFDNH